MALTWEEGVILSYQEELRLKREWPDWDGRSTPRAIPDWWVALNDATELGITIFQLYGLPLEPPFTELALLWVHLRRSAQNKAERIRAGLRALKFDTQRTDPVA